MGISRGTWGAFGPAFNVDLGITEGINKAVGGALNSFGNLFVNPAQSQSRSIGPQSTNPALQPGNTVQQANKILGAATQNTGGTRTTTQTTNPVQTQGQGGGGGEYVDPYAGLSNDISSGWDQYLGSLDNQLYGLGDQRTAQEGIANSQFNQGVNTLDLSKTQGLDQLGNQRVQAEQNQAKTLRDLGSNLKNSFMAGNVYLGSRGAGDSSAANQYAFALTKMGSQQRGDIMNNTSNIMNDISGRETNLNNIYNTEKKNLQEGLNQQISGIAQWYSNAVQNLQAQKAQGQLSKSQDLQSLSKDILNQALSQLSSIQQSAQQRQSSLDSWAMSNSQNLSQLKQNLSSVASPSYQLPQSQSLTGTPQFTSDGRIFVPPGYGTNTTEKKTTLFP